MSNTIAVVIAVIGILALFAAAGALFAVFRKAGNHAVPAPHDVTTVHGSAAPELSAEAEQPLVMTRARAPAARAAER